MEASAAGSIRAAEIFAGFLAGSGAKALDVLDGPWAVILYEAPHRVLATVRALLARFGPEREIAIARELSKKFEEVDYVIVDEVHEVCDSKRGVALSVALERLQNYCQREFVRIGLSATVAPLEQVAEYLVGLRNGRSRDAHVVEVFRQRDLDIEVICPTKDMTALPSRS